MSQSFYTDPELCKRLHHGRGEGMKAYIYFFKWEWLYIRVLLFYSWLHSCPQMRVSQD